MNYITEGYDEDGDLMRLRDKLAIIHRCRKLAHHPNLEPAFRRLVDSLPEDQELFSVEELRQIIEKWRDCDDDPVAEEEMDSAILKLEQEIQTLVAHHFDNEFCRSLIEASPVTAGTLTRQDFLSGLFPAGTFTLLLDLSNSDDGVLCQGDNVDDRPNVWWWPLPVRVESQQNGRIKKSKDAVSSWKSATARFSPEDILLMTDLIVSRQIPVRLVMVRPDGVQVVFNIDAAGEGDWRSKCQTLRAQLQNLGVKCPTFRYDTLVPMIHMEMTRLVYFFP